MTTLLLQLLLLLDFLNGAIKCYPCWNTSSFIWSNVNFFTNFLIQLPSPTCYLLPELFLSSHSKSSILSVSSVQDVHIRVWIKMIMTIKRKELPLNTKCVCENDSFFPFGVTQKMYSSILENNSNTLRIDIAVHGMLLLRLFTTIIHSFIRRKDNNSFKNKVNDFKDVICILKKFVMLRNYNHCNDWYTDAMVTIKCMQITQKMSHWKKVTRDVEKINR